ncbi:hypothetical protein ACWGB8_21005 [Kitasatospora sp. NPDC054939]
MKDAITRRIIKDALLAQLPKEVSRQDAEAFAKDVADASLKGPASQQVITDIIKRHPGLAAQVGLAHRAARRPALAFSFDPAPVPPPPTEPPLSH